MKPLLFVLIIAEKSTFPLPEPYPPPSSIRLSVTISFQFYVESLTDVEQHRELACILGSVHAQEQAVFISLVADIPKRRASKI